MNKDSWGKRMDYNSNLIGHKIRAYDLRHCFALYYLRAGGDVFSLQRMMGHSNLAMTQKYIALTEQDLRNQHAKSSPLHWYISINSTIRSSSYYLLSNLWSYQLKADLRFKSSPF
jgi:integrase